MISQEQRYSEVALAYIEAIYKETKETETAAKAKAFEQVCYAFPSMVMLNGLRLTVTFFQGKSDAHRNYIEHLGKAIEVDDLPRNIPRQSTAYSHLSQRALKASVWFKRYAEAFLKDRS